MLRLVTRVLALGMALAGVVGFAATGPAVAYPTKPIEFVCTTTPGSTAANWCQLMAQLLSTPDILGKPVNVSYKPAGSGNEAAVYTMQRPADGYTLMHAGASMAGYVNLPTWAVKRDDLELAVKVEKFLYAIAVHADSEHKTFKDLVAAAKKSPGKIGVAGNKIGSIHHKLILETFLAAGADINYIPYEGSGDAVKDVLGKHVPAGLASIGQWQGQVAAGKIRPLLVINEERVPAFPDTPTTKEAGVDFPIRHQWQGLFLKKGTPPEVWAKLAEAFGKVVKTKAYQDYTSKAPHVIAALETDRAKLAKDFAAEVAGFREIMIKAGMVK